MKSAYSIYDTKTHLSKIMQRVKNGDEVIVTERGTPVAKIIPIKKEVSFEDRLESMISRGVVLPRKSSKLPLGIKKSGALKRFLVERE